MLDIENEVYVDMTNKINTYSLNEETLLNDIFNKTVVEEECIAVLMCPWNSNGGEAHPAGQECIDANRTGADALYYIFTGNCTGSGGGIGDTNPTDTSSGPNYGGDTTVSNTSVTTLSPMQKRKKDFKIKLRQLNLNQCENVDNNLTNEDWEELDNYLESEALLVDPYGLLIEYPEEAESFAISAIEAICEYDDIDFEDASEFVEILEEIPTAKLERFRELKNLLAINPWALIQNCAEQNGLDTSNYLDLYNLSFPAECSDRLFNLGVEWHHQSISDGNVPLANIDYYGVEVTNYPDFNNDGNPDSESEIFQAFRENFTELASGEVDSFEFSCNIPFNPSNTGDIDWEFIPLTPQDGIDFISNDPIASILLIEADATGVVPTIATDDGAVIVSEFTDNDWTISTIMTANNGTQPFSGNRQWGWVINQNGNLELFTRAVDVANISALLNVLSFGSASSECQQETYYDIAEATWENLQQEIVDWINSPESNGGQASIIPKTAIRVDKEKIEELLISNETINQINCD